MHVSMASRKEEGSSGSHHRRSHSQAEVPLSHFFKIILPATLKDKKLRIPNKFVIKFGEELAEVAEVAVPNGHAWKIGLTKDKSNIWFDDGWQKFVEHHSIRRGYLLVFRYRGCSNFDVLLFNKTCCEVQYPRTGPMRSTGRSRPTRGVEMANYDENCSFYDVDEMEDKGFVGKTDSQNHFAFKSGVSDENAGESSKRDTPPSMKKVIESPRFERSNDKRSKRPVKQEDIEISDLDPNELTVSKLSKKCRLSSSSGTLINETKTNKCKSKTRTEVTESLPECEEGMEIVVHGFAMASEESKKAIHAARMFKPKYPSFMVLLRPYNKCFVAMPTDFAKRHLRGVPEYINIQVSDGRQWPIRINKKRRPRMIISKGWNEFHRENNLKEGDVCVFELIKDNRFSLKVTIFPAAEDGPSN